MTDALSVPRAFKLSSTGLTVVGTPSFIDWEQGIEALKAIEGAVQFWIGDLLNYGEHVYGEKYAQAVDSSQAKTWANYAYVSKAIEISRRREECSFSVHAAVAALPSDRQDELLDAAASNGHTVKQVQAAAKHETDEEPGRLVTCPECGHQWRME